MDPVHEPHNDTIYVGLLRTTHPASRSHPNSPCDISLTDDTLLTDWMRLHGDKVLRTAFLLLRDRHWAEDIYQETFLVAYRKRHQLLDPARVSGWLLKIAVNLCRQKMRTSAWRRLVFRDQINENIPSSSPDPEAHVTSSLTAEVHRLPYKYREVITLFYYHSLTIPEICDLLREAEGTIKSRLARARTKLRDMLSEEDAHRA